MRSKRDGTVRGSAIGELAVSTLDATQLYYREEGYGLGWLDHADHLATAELVVAAYVRHHRRSTTTSLHQYRAYNTGREPANVGADTLAKRGAFFRYMALGEGLEYTNGYSTIRTSRASTTRRGRSAGTWCRAPVLHTVASRWAQERAVSARSDRSSRCRRAPVHRSGS